jgi:hypothetical protein
MKTTKRLEHVNAEIALTRVNTGHVNNLNERLAAVCGEQAQHDALRAPNTCFLVVTSNVDVIQCICVHRTNRDNVRSGSNNQTLATTATPAKS